MTEPTTPSPEPTPTPGSTPGVTSGAGAAADPTVNSATPATPADGTIPDPADVEKNKVITFFSYLGVLLLIPLLAAPKSPFVRYHANQGLSLLVCLLPLGFILFLCSIAIAFILPLIGLCFDFVVWFTFLAGCLTFMIIGMMNVANGRQRPLPLIGKIRLLK